LRRSSGGASSDDTEVDGRQRDVFRTREAEKVRHDLAERFGLLTMPSTYGWYFGGMASTSIQAGLLPCIVAQAVAELVRETP
jgi:hypothetical protein